MYEGGLSWQDGGCATPNPHPARGQAPWNPRMLGGFGLLASPTAEDMKGNNDSKDRGRTAARRWVTVRATEEEWQRWTATADMAGLSTSEYVRRKLDGGRPLIAQTDATTIRELRRIGGLLKHNFSVLREVGAPTGIIKQQEETLRLLARTIAVLGKKAHDSEEN